MSKIYTSTNVSEDNINFDSNEQELYENNVEKSEISKFEVSGSERLKHNSSNFHEVKKSFLEDSDDEDSEEELKIKKKSNNITIDDSDEEDSEDVVRIKRKVRNVILDDDSDNENDRSTVIENYTTASDKEDDEIDIEDPDESLLDQDKENIIDDDSDMSSSPPSDCEEENDLEDSETGDGDDSVRIYRSGDTSHHDGGSFAAEEAEMKLLSKKQKQSNKRSKQSETLMKLKSETQRMIRESKVNLPYHTPESVGLSDYLKSRKKVKEEIVNFSGKESDKVKKHRSKMMSLLEKKLGKPVPKLSNDFREVLTVERKINQSVELEPKKLNLKVLNFKQRLLPRKDKKIESDKTKFDRKMLKEKLKASMRVNREQERLRKEEERKIDNEEIADEDGYDEEEAELTDDESFQDDINEHDKYQDIATENLHKEEILSVDCSEGDEEDGVGVKESLSTSNVSDEEASFRTTVLNSTLDCANDFNENLNDSRSQSLFKDKNLSDLEMELPPNHEILSSPKSVHNTSGCSFFNTSFPAESHVFNSEISNCSEIATFDQSPEKKQENLIDLVLEAESDNANDGTEIGSSFLNFLSHNFTATDNPKNKNNTHSELINEDQCSPWISSQDPKYENADRESSDDEDEAIIIRKKKHSQNVSKKILVDNKQSEEIREDSEEVPIIENYLDEEAELSGDDAGEGDEFDEGKDNDYYEDDGVDEELPDQDELKNQVNRVHQRQLLDEDRREIELLQEAFVEDNPFNNRKRRFRWKNINDGGFTQNIINDADNSDGDDVLEDVDEESQWRSERLQREEFLANLSNKEDFCDEDSKLLKIGRLVVENSKSRFSSNSRLSAKEMIHSASNSSCRFQPPVDSFLKRGNDYHSKIIKIADMKSTKSAVNSEKMVFKKAEKSDINQTEQIAKKRHSLSSSGLVIKKPKKTFEIDINDNSNSVFDLF